MCEAQGALSEIEDAGACLEVTQWIHKSKITLNIFLKTQLLIGNIFYTVTQYVSMHIQLKQCLPLFCEMGSDNFYFLNFILIKWPKFARLYVC